MDKKILVFIIILIMGVCVGEMIQAKADTIDNIDIDVAIEDNGDANITEIWSVDYQTATECGKTFTRLDNKDVLNVSVTDELGTVYTFVPSLDVNLSIFDKANKYCLTEGDKDKKLTWGITTYGKKTFTIKYLVKNFVEQYTDAAGTYFIFVNKEQEVKKAKITLRATTPLSSDDINTKLLGCDGNIKYDTEGGVIIVSSKGVIDKDSNMTLILKYHERFYNLSKSNKCKFEDYYIKYLKNPKNDKVYETNSEYRRDFFKNIGLLVGIGIVITVVPAVVFGVIVKLVRRKKNRKKDGMK